MPRPGKLVKNELSCAIIELRRRLKFSQQGFAVFLGMSIAGVARWELNQRPHRTVLERLIQLAYSHDFRDLAGIFYTEYQREFRLSTYDRAFAREAVSKLQAVIGTLELLPEPKNKLYRAAKRDARQKLEQLVRELSQFPPDRTDPTDMHIISEPPKDKGNQ
jgi:transcriptional regulator with XRE-family HTH domain